jgi:hypothetical protein
MNSSVKHKYRPYSGAITTTSTKITKDLTFCDRTSEKEN